MWKKGASLWFRVQAKRPQPQMGKTIEIRRQWEMKWLLTTEKGKGIFGTHISVWDINSNFTTSENGFSSILIALSNRLAKMPHTTHDLNIPFLEKDLCNWSFPMGRGDSGASLLSRGYCLLMAREEGKHSTFPKKYSLKYSNMPIFSQKYSLKRILLTDGQREG